MTATMEAASRLAAWTKGIQVPQQQQQQQQRRRLRWRRQSRATHEVTSRPSSRQACAVPFVHRSSPTTASNSRRHSTAVRSSSLSSSSTSITDQLPVRDAGCPPSPWPLLDAMDDLRMRRRSVPASAKTNDVQQPATMHWTLSEPLTEECECCDAVSREAGVSIELAKELLDMGAVYVDSWPEGNGGKVKWQRAHALNRKLQPGRD